mgnify:CR=1 FL=1
MQGELPHDQFQVLSKLGGPVVYAKRKSVVLVFVALICVSAPFPALATDLLPRIAASQLSHLRLAPDTIHNHDRIGHRSVASDSAFGVTNM